MLYYKKTQRKDPQNPDAAAKYYPTHVTKGKIEMRELAEKVSARAGHSVGSVFCVLTDMVDVIIEEIKRSNSCSIAELGGFRLTIQGYGSDTSEDYNLNLVSNTKLVYQPSTRIKNALKVSAVQITEMPTYTLQSEPQP